MASSRVEIFQRDWFQQEWILMRSTKYFKTISTITFPAENIGELTYLSVISQLSIIRVAFWVRLTFRILLHRIIQSGNFDFYCCIYQPYVLLLLASIIIAVFIANQITATGGYTGEFAKNAVGKTQRTNLLPAQRRNREFGKRVQ